MTKIFAKNEKPEKLIQTIRIFSQNIGMEYGNDKCVILIMKSGKRESEDRKELPNQESEPFQ